MGLRRRGARATQDGVSSQRYGGSLSAPRRHVDSSFQGRGGGHALFARARATSVMRCACAPRDRPSFRPLPDRHTHTQACSACECMRAVPACGCACSACVQCMRAVHACSACVQCMRAVHACSACVQCMGAVHARIAYAQCMRAGHACTACVQCVRAVPRSPRSLVRACSASCVRAVQCVRTRSPREPREPPHSPASARRARRGRGEYNTNSSLPTMTKAAAKHRAGIAALEQGASTRQSRSRS